MSVLDAMMLAQELISLPSGGDLPHLHALLEVFGDCLRVEYLCHAFIMPSTKRNGITVCHKAQATRPATRCDSLRYVCAVSPADAISKQQRGLSPRSQCSRTDTPATSATKASAIRQTSGCSGVTPASGQL